MCSPCWSLGVHKLEMGQFPQQASGLPLLGAALGLGDTSAVRRVGHGKGAGTTEASWWNNIPKGWRAAGHLKSLRGTRAEALWWEPAFLVGEKEGGPCV